MRCRIRRSFGAWRAPSISPSRNSTRATPTCCPRCCRAAGSGLISRRWRRRARSGFRASRPCSSPAGCLRRRAGASRSPASARRRTACHGCRSAGAIRDRRTAICACCRRRIRGCSTRPSAMWARSTTGWGRRPLHCILRMPLLGVWRTAMPPWCTTSRVDSYCASSRRTELPQGVALAHKGRWLGTDAAAANVNALNPGDKSDMGESTAVHSVQVRVQGAAAP